MANLRNQAGGSGGPGTTEPGGPSSGGGGFVWDNGPPSDTVDPFDPNIPPQGGPPGPGSGGGSSGGGSPTTPIELPDPWSPWDPIGTVLGGGIDGGLISLVGTLANLGAISQCMQATNSGLVSGLGTLGALSGMGNWLGQLRNLLGGLLPKGAACPGLSASCKAALSALMSQYQSLQSQQFALLQQINAINSQMASIDCSNGGSAVGGLGTAANLQSQIDAITQQAQQLNDAINDLANDITNLLEQCSCGQPSKQFLRCQPGKVAFRGADGGLRCIVRGPNDPPPPPPP